jgi:hypothetical protein
VTRRTIAVLWLIVGIALWNGIFDLYVSRGAREYLQLSAEAELGRVPQPSMAEVMARAERMGLIAATLWAGTVIAGGWLTIRLVSKRRGSDPTNPQ